MKNKIVKRILFSLLAVLLVIVLVAGCYVGYVVIDYSRIDDNLALSPVGNGQTEVARVKTEYTVMTYNVGFGAYTPDFTFFMDGGNESRAKSKESVEYCINSAGDEVKSNNPDFIFFQEVDTGSTRSFQTEQREMLVNKFNAFSSVFAVNYHSAYLFYPIFCPHGKSNSGILTLSNVKINSSVRRQLPISTSFSKFLDLDRCYSVSKVAVENGKELVLYNVHLSAYGNSDEIRKAQMSMLFNDMKAEYEKGNYCVCGGDFNHDFTGDSTVKLNNGKNTEFGWAQPFPEDLIPSFIRRAMEYEEGKLEPTCRNCDIPYKKGNQTFIVDGFLVTENVETISVQNLQTDFAYSDHNPVKMTFILKDN